MVRRGGAGGAEGGGGAGTVKGAVRSPPHDARGRELSDLGGSLDRHMKTLVILPTYNESATVAEVLRRIRASATHTIDVLVVDDNSPDGTADLALADELGGIDVLRRPNKAGLGSAYREGFKLGLAQGYEALVEMDADLSHDPSVLGDLLAELEGGAA